MTPRHFRFWPKGLPKSLTAPRVPLHELLEVSARRYPDKAATWFFGAALAWREAHEQVLRLAGFLQRGCGVRPGDRVLVDLQNSPQFLLAAYAIARADAVMVPVSPMCVAEELAHYLEDSGARGRDRRPGGLAAPRRARRPHAARARDRRGLLRLRRRPSATCRGPRRSRRRASRSRRAA